VFGDRGAGKRQIIREINKQFVKGKNKVFHLQEMGSDFSAIDNFFLYVKDLSDNYLQVN